MTVAVQVTGLILAGGQAHRMQGVDKGLLDLCGEPLIAHARRALTPHVQHILVSANRNPSSYASYGEVLPDDATLGSQLGPLAGIERALAASRTLWLAVLPVDVVGLPNGLMPRLMHSVDAAGPLIAYARTPERVHPLCMVLHASLAPSLRAYLLAGERKVQTWQQQHHAVAVLFDEPDAFININTPEDLRYASQRCRS